MISPISPTSRTLRIGAAVCLLGALSGSPGTAAADPTVPVPPPPPPAPTLTTPVTDACPHRIVAPPAVDASEAPPPGAPEPTPLPVPNPAIGGEQLSACGVIAPAGAPPVPPGIDSAGWLVADDTSGRVIAAKDPHGRYRPASTIKLLLVQVALRDLDLDQVVTGTAEDDAQDGTAAGVAPGGLYTVRQLLEAVILFSGNDAAHAIARQLGGVDAAVAAMNRLAAALGAHDTRAATPSGLDGPGQTTSAYDLALILRSALNDPRFVEIARIPQITFPGHPPVPTSAPPPASTPPAPPQFPPAPAPPSTESPPPPPTSVAPYPIFNDNRLLTLFPGAVAGKTGYTDDAKKTFVGAVDGRQAVHRGAVVRVVVRGQHLLGSVRTAAGLRGRGGRRFGREPGPHCARTCPADRR